MERLTFEGNFCDIAMCTRMRGSENCESGSCSQRDVWERLKGYEDAEEQGLLVRLPCSVGENVYFVLPDSNGYLGYFISEPHKITECGTRGFWTSGIPDECPDSMDDFTPWAEISKTVFLTHQDAEKALEEIKNV